MNGYNFTHAYQSPPIKYGEINIYWFHLVNGTHTYNLCLMHLYQFAEFIRATESLISSEPRQGA